MKVKMKFVAAVLSMLLVMTCLPTVGMAEGTVVPLDSGSISITAGTTYSISDEAQLANFAAIVNGTGGAAAQTCAGATFQLTADISISADHDPLSTAGNWKPIGTSIASFDGTFDGDGHEISGLIVSGDYQNVGFFGYVNSHSIIENVGISGSVTSYFSSSLPGVGGVAGYNNGGIIRNCNTIVLVTYSGSGQYPFAGCIAGYNNSGTIRDCHNIGTVTIIGTVLNPRGGGIVGCNSAGVVMDCGNLGSITYNGSTDSRIGGIAGWNNASGVVQSCNNSGALTGYYNTGGVVGINSSGIIRNCYNTGSVTGNRNIGGVVGENSAGGNTQNCYNIGMLTGNYFIGGIAGFNDFSTLLNCYWLDGTAVLGIGRANGSGSVLSAFTSEGSGTLTAEITIPGYEATDSLLKALDNWVDANGSVTGLLYWGLGSDGYHYPILGTSSSPLSLGATAGDSQVSLEWIAPASNGGSAIQGYNIYRDGAKVNATLVTGTTYLDSGIANGTTYSYVVSAVTAQGESAGSDAVVVTLGGEPPQVTVPGSPTSLLATAGDAQVSLGWTAPVSNGGSAIQGYNIYRDSVKLNDAPVAGETYLDTGLINGTTYSYAVSAVNVQGESTKCDAVNATPEVAAPEVTVPDAPASLLATAGDKQVSLGWTAPASDGGSTILGYNIHRDGEKVNVALVTEVTYLDTGLTNGTSYSYTVSAVNAQGESVECSASTATPHDKWKQLAGDSRYETMEAISQEGFDNADTVIVATGENYPDALAAAGLAGIDNAPILLTAQGSLSPEVASEITRLGAHNVIIVGGTGVVSSAIETQLGQVNGVASVTRSSGDDRVATALDIYAKGGTSWSRTAIIATGFGFADALSIAPYAYATDSPIFLTGGAATTADISSATKAAITTDNFDKVVIVGGIGVVSQAVEDELIATYTDENVTRLSGDDRYQTSSKIADFAALNGLTYKNIAVATGTNFPDALAGSALCGKNASVLLLVDDSTTGLFCVDNTIYGNKSDLIQGYFLGGYGAVSSALRTKITAASL